VHHFSGVGKRLGDVENLHLLQGDVTDMSTLRPAMDGVTAVVHTVAIAIEQVPGTYEMVNTEGTRNVLTAAEEAGVSRFIHISQLGCAPDLPYPFLRSKGLAEEVVRRSALDWTVLRPSVIFGPTDEFANVLARLILLSPFVFPVPGDGGARFQPVYVGDVAACVVRALADDSTIHGRYELGGPEALTYDQIVDRVLETLGTRRRKIRLPLTVMRPLVRLMQAALPNPPVTVSLLDMLAIDNTTEDRSLSEVFGVQPTPFTPDNLTYMRDFTVREAWQRFFRQKK
jgi:NADH dehydrogenase